VYQQGIASNNATYPLLFPSSLLSMSLMYSVVDDDNDAVLDFPMPNILNVSKVKDMAKMFSEVSLFNQNAGSWDMSNVTNMCGLLNAATPFNQDLGSECINGDGHDRNVF
jgi:hypothetical protein